MGKHGRIQLQPPIILAIENASQYGNVALVSATECIAESSLLSNQTHSQRLLTAIDRLIGDSGIELEAIDAMAISLGPGSFTGLRIGLSTAKGLCMASAKPLIGVPTLDGLALQHAYQPYPVWVVMDARKNEVFAACYQMDSSHLPKRITEFMAIKPQSLMPHIKGPALLVGDGLTVYGDLFKEQLDNSIIFIPPRHTFPRAASIGYIGMSLYQKGDFLDPATASPLYIRASDAEINRKR